MASLSYKQKRIYLILFSAIVSITALGLVMNTRTLPLIHKRHKVLLELHDVRAENRQLELQVVSANSLQNIERTARERLQMIPARQPIFIDQP